MSELSLVLPEVNKPDKTEDPKIVTAFTAIQTFANGNIGGTNVTDDLTGRRLLDRQDGFFEAGDVSGDYVFSGGDLVLAGAAGGKSVALLRLEATDYAVSGKVTQLTLRGWLGVNATAPAANFSFSLFPIASLAGAANQMVTNLGVATVTSSAILAPAAKSITQVSVAPFMFPADGWYVLTANLEGTVAASSIVTANVALFVLNA